MPVGTLSSPGVGSNIDIAGIVSRLMELERIPLNRLNDKKDGYDAKISALGTIKSSLSSLQSAMNGLKSGSSFEVFKIASSDSTAVTATAGTGALAGTHTVEVTQLAQSQKLVAAGQADTTITTFGVGTLTIDFGTISGGSFSTYDPPTGTGQYTGAGFAANGSGSQIIPIESGKNTLEGIRDAINTAGVGVQASIVNDGDASNPYRLVLSSENSGASESIRIAVAGDAALSNLLGHDPAGTQNLAETVTAQNAILKVDGLTITKSSNIVTDAIAGVNLTLANETTGPVTLSATQDTDSVKNSIEAFVKAYNDLYKQIQTQTDSGVNGGKEGALASDSATRQLLSSIRTELSQAVTGLSGSYNSLSSIGVSFQRDGSLKVDSAQLGSALADDSDNVAELFTSADGYGTRIGSMLSNMLSAAGVIASRTDSFQDRVRSLEDQQATLEGRLERTETYLRAQYGALDVLVGSMSITSSYLTQQLAGLNANS